MYAAERQQWLLNRTRDAGRLDVAVTAEELDVSAETIRRDLDVLERQGLLRRVHGGAIPADLLGFEPGISARDAVAAQEKERIAKAALDELDGATTVLLDAGTTTARLASLLPADRELTVVTNALPIASMLAARPNITLLLLGAGPRHHDGHRRRVGARRPRRPHRRRRVPGRNGFSVDRGLTTPDHAEAAAKKAMLGAARRAVVLADSAKHGADQFVRFGRLDQVDALITDTGLTPDAAAALSAAGPRVVRA